MSERVSTTPRPAPYSRRTNKPLVEKRRRARINDCLGELKTLVLQAMKQDSAQISRLEKADILEMTVKYLHHVQRQQSNTAMVNNPQSAAKYRAGFTECASEVMRYMTNIQGINPNISNKLTGHLAGCLSMVNSATAPQMAIHTAQTPSPIKQEVYQRPLQIQIPDNKLKVSPSGTNVLLVPARVGEHPQNVMDTKIVTPIRPVPTNYTPTGLKNITNTYSSPTSHSMDIKSCSNYYSPKSSTSPCSKDSYSLVPKQLYDSISPVHSPPSCAFQEEKLWRPW